MPLQTGTWTANFGGTVIPFQIQSVDPQGNVSALIGQGKAFGFWDEDAQRLYLICSAQGNPPWQTLTAYLFEDSVNLTGITGSVIFSLAGVVEDFGAGAGAMFGPTSMAKCSTFGWYAQIGVD